LFAADRNEHLYGSGGIVDLCEKNTVVVSDRYVLSSLVYQGLVCKSDMPERLNADFPYPELILYFDIEAEMADQRLASREKKDTYEKLDFQIQVHRRYGELLPRYTAHGSRLVRINAALSIEEVSEEVWRALHNLPILGG
jgi:dTMP kinase